MHDPLTQDDFYFNEKIGRGFIFKNKIFHFGAKKNWFKFFKFYFRFQICRRDFSKVVLLFDKILLTLGSCCCCCSCVAAAVAAVIDVDFVLATFAVVDGVIVATAVIDVDVAVIAVLL